MAKNRYKIGLLAAVKNAQDNTTEHGVIEAIITRADGFQYKIAGFDHNESDILAVYQEIKTTKTTKPKKRQAKRQAVEAPTEIPF